jgi:Fe-S cluster assembly iron-binding protein IscA
MQIKITPAAAEELKRKLGDKKDQPNTGIRIYVAGYGWAGPVFNLTQDVSKDDDIVVEAEGLKFIFPKEQAQYINGFEIDYRGGIFGKRLIVEQLGAAGGSCH